MPKASFDSTTAARASAGASRRGLLSVASLLPLAALPALPAIAAEPDADRELIALCSEFDRLEAQWKETDTDAPVGDVEREQARDADQERIGVAQHALAERMHAIRAVTFAGHAARARSLVGWAPDLLETADTIEDMLRAAIYRDLTDLPVAAARVIQPSPPQVPPVDADHDKALMATCEQHIAELAAFNADRSGSESDDPVWDAYWQTKQAINEAEPRTFAGLCAKARAAKAHLDTRGGRDGGAGVRWALDTVDSLMRIVGEG